ncbi:regulatory protein, luxR family [Actinokineospora alba]|uniref:Regulatory protein, luxR family n=1 Tax=Actinokineospora alba TaxID=504798 RepID=A0A1H0F6V5_9PSEU|nr:LuxR family transcriptional regulator [Actinokineospora alba]TDP69362.1 regulatory LuxR family protein [Actinokineospora alba]SDI18377.1 regulatory protein, luxR family [Actinokineospora alba]SDN90305.1 regulatory protein, luxR family [Actinokineospora alba]
MDAVAAIGLTDLTGFVGRTAETKQLRASADKVLAGSPQLVRVEGEAGIGKTNLVNHFLAGLDKFTVLAASGDPAESTLSYGLVDQLLARVNRQLVGRFKLLDRSRPSTATPFAVGADFLALVGELQADQPVAIVLDDVQWADRPSAQALGFMLRRLWADQVLAVMLIRTPVVEDETEVVNQYLSRPTIDSVTIRLGGLTSHDIAALSAAVTSGELPLPAAARLRAHTDGNPLYVRALLAEASPADLIAGESTLPVPKSLLTAVGRILNRLPEETRHLVEALAVLNARCSLARAAQLASVDKPSEALAPALAAGLVQWWPTEPANPVAMRHGLHRDAVYESLDPVRRAELHATAAGLVDSTTAWAHRVAAAQSTDGRLARQLEVAATEETASGRNDLAARYLHWAAELSETRDEYEHRLLTACVQSLLTSQPGWAVSRQAEVRRCSDTPLRDCALGLTALLGTGELAEAEVLLQRAADADAATTPAWMRSTIAGALAALHVWRGRGGEALRMASSALSMGGLVSRWEDFVRVIHAVARVRQDGPAAGLAELDHLPTKAAAVSSDDLDCLCCRGALHTMLGHYSEALDDLATAIRHQRAGANILSGPAPHSYLAAAQYAVGDWNDAAITMHQALSIQSTFEQPQHHTLTQMTATLVPAGRGDWQAATAHVREAQRWAAKVGTPQDIRYAAIAGAVVAQARADHAGMLSSLRPLLDTDLDQTDSLHAWWVAWWRPLLVEALIGVGELDTADRHLVRLGDTTRDVRHLEDTLSRLRAALARERGRLDDAFTIYRSRLDGDDGEPMVPFARAMLEQDFGQLLLGTGHRREALQWLRRARDRYTLLSAHPFIRRVDQGLDTSGARHTARSASKLPDLTEREEQVSYLASRGLTNGEIAKELYVTNKTVEYHLSNVYAKLGVASRRELGAALDTERVG